MSFDSRDQANRLFQMRDFSRSTLAPVRFVEAGKSLKTPEFLVRREPGYLTSLDSVKVLCKRTKLPASSTLKYLYRDASLTGFQAPGMGFANSLVVHGLLILGLLYIPYALQPEPPSVSSFLSTQEIIYYPVPEHKAVTALPRIAPRGPGGRPGSGFHPEAPPAPGRTKSDASLTAISKPLHPDNFHQTIIQPTSPPDVRIPNDQKLPNIALGLVNAPKKPKFDLDLSIKKPMQENAKLQAEMAAPTADTSAPFAMASTLQPANAQPKMPVPAGPIARPMRHGIQEDGAEGAEVPDVGEPGQGRAILVIGIDPSGSVSELSLPRGNRSGDFSIAPGAGTAGSPNGRTGGVDGGGSGGNAHGGDGSVGIGAGHDGGGGGKEGLLGTLSVKGGTNGASGALALDPYSAKMVYPVPGSLALNLRKNRMVVSTGPMGGGGLSVYGALPCGKIYTIFLPMTESNWTMQYCQKANPADAAKTEPRSTVIQLEAGLVPPDPDMASRYDFHRVSLPPGKANKLIVLKGTLQEDGSIDGLQVYQGIVPQMDEAARIAFSRWKFKPATRAGKPVALEILVGIPTDNVPGSESQ